MALCVLYIYSNLLDDCLGLARHAGDESTCSVSTRQPDPLACPDPHKLRSTPPPRPRAHQPPRPTPPRERDNGGSGASALANVLRCPPASLPCVTTASTPTCARATASSTVVAVPIRNMPRPLMASMALAGSRPNVKLKTAAPLSRATASCSSNVLPPAAGSVGGGKPSSA